MKRYLTKFIEEDLTRKMVFLSGPRQVGKTTLAKGLLPVKQQHCYLNWDIDEDREKILKKNLPVGKLWIFDELHRYRKWRDYLKGLFDKHGKSQQILVTGSARLDLYRYGGDTLQGRYHFLRLHPLSVAELKIKTTAGIEELFKLGGFPEQFNFSSEKQSRRWSLEYRSRLIQEEISTIEGIRDLGTLELLVSRLPDLVGSPLSINSLREDLNMNHQTISRWLDVLERFYSFFRIMPYGSPKLRAVKKEQKHYHYDWTLLTEDGPRFENFIACHLIKWCNFQRDVEGRDLELKYFRDFDLREVDFVITERSKPAMFVECKLGDAEVSKGLKYLKARFKEVKSHQVHLRGKKSYQNSEGILVQPALDFLQELV